MSIFDEPKIDCHNHLLDPVNFPYNPDAWYHPVANEQGSAGQLTELFNAYGARYATIVGPNSGYDTDNRCLLDAIARSNGRFKGLAVVDNQICRSRARTAAGQRHHRHHHAGRTARGGPLRGTEKLLHQLAELQMFVDVQVQGDQLVEMAPLLEPSGVRVLIDHCGRPDPAAGLDQPGFRTLLELAPPAGISSRSPGW